MMNYRLEEPKILKALYQHEFTRKAEYCLLKDMNDNYALFIQQGKRNAFIPLLGGKNEAVLFHQKQQKFCDDPKELRFDSMLPY